ncbi:type VI secretion system baseplate subunit TssG [Sorangium sp. So ce726]|uniref:type VI secretion system baseplate subunit TssG n=1 Tax=Sorangium sp. So ce726 TaxID=3133319 RepID=UPI003F5D8C5D
MATDGRREGAPLEDWLFAESRRFDFFQAVALLEARAEGCRSVGESSEPAAEAVRLRGAIDLAFPETDVAGIERPAREGEPPVLTASFMSLAGALGPLPPPFAELVYQRAARRDFALRDFLDIFNHRLLSLVYRIRKRHRIGLGVASPEQDDAARYLYALIGLGLPSLRGRLPVSDRALLEPAALVARELRPMGGLTALLRHHLRVPIEAAPLTGAYHPIEESDRTAIGPSGRNRGLGRGAILGRRAWDQEAGFELVVGPLSLRDYVRCLPGGDLLEPLCALTRFYAGEVLSFTVLLRLRAEEAPAARLGKRHGARLGTTACLGGGARRREPIEKRLRGAALAQACDVNGVDSQARGAAAARAAVGDS